MADPQQPGFVSSVLRDTGQRMVPGGQSGRGGGRRSFTEVLGNILGSTLVPLPGGGSLGAELGERAAATPFGNAVNHPLQSLGSLFNRQREYTGPQLSPNLNTSIWNIGGLRGNSPSYMGFGSGTGAFPYHGNAAATSGGDIYNSALAPSQQFVDNREHSNTAQGMEGITSPNTRGLSANAAALASYGPGYIYLYIKPPNNAANISGGGARDHFSGTSGSSNWGNTFESLGMLGSQGGGLDPQRNRNVGEQRRREYIASLLKANPNDERALQWRQEQIDNRTAGR